MNYIKVNSQPSRLSVFHYRHFENLNKITPPWPVHSSHGPLQITSFHAVVLISLRWVENTSAASQSRCSLAFALPSSSFQMLLKAPHGDKTEGKNLMANMAHYASAQITGGMCGFHQPKVWHQSILCWFVEHRERF